MTSAYLSAVMTNQQEQSRLDQLLRKVFKPGGWGMLLCVASFILASVLVAYVGLQWQERFSTTRLDAGTKTLTHAWEGSAYVELAPGAKANVVEYSNRREVHMLTGSAVLHVSGDQSMPTSLHIGNKAYPIADATVQVSVAAERNGVLSTNHELLVLQSAVPDPLG